MVPHNTFIPVLHFLPPPVLFSIQKYGYFLLLVQDFLLAPQNGASPNHLKDSADKARFGEVTNKLTIINDTLGIKFFMIASFSVNYSLGDG